MQESCPYGSVRGAPSNGCPYRNPSVTRNLGGYPGVSTPTTASDTTVLGNSPYPSFHNFLENTPHGYSHVYIGGSSGDMSSIPTAAGDPFFFMLHGNVDRLWAQWQRDQSSLARLDTATTYDTETGNVNITTLMGPWDGIHGASIQPWTPAGGYIVSKSPKDPSVVSPPIYDTAPLTIPVLQPGEAVVIQIPWYPPNPADFSCFGGDQGHFCLLARIETSTSAPFGMTFPETGDVYANTRNNNNIAWKNITVVDNFPGPLAATSILIRNIFEGRVQTSLRFAATQIAAAQIAAAQTFGGSFLDTGRIFVDLKPELFKRWLEGGAAGRGIKVVDDIQTGRKVVDDTHTGRKVVDDTQRGRLEIVAPDALIQNITLNPKDTFSVDLQFELPRGYPLRRGPFPELDLIQIGAPGDPEAIVGGQRFVLDFSKLVLVKSGDYWRYRDEFPGEAWTSSHYDDSEWKLGKAEFVFGNNPTTTRYFRHTFDVADPSFYRSLVLWLKRDDGAVVYLNGEQIHRVDQRVVKINPRNLTRDKNVIAVKIQQNSPRSDDLKNLPGSDDVSFDLELSANRADPGFSPDIAFVGPPNGALFQADEIIPVKLEAEALDSDGTVQSVSLYVDGKLVGTLEQPPYTFRVPAGSKGSHRLRAVAIDNDQRQSESFLTVTVVENVPPEVNLTRPLDGTAVRAGQPISVSAQASDRGGTVKRVEFWVREADFFMSQSRLAATATTAPYKASIGDLRPGHYMLWAVAVDDRDGTSQSMPVHIAIQ
jgi:hypothetical protein